MKFQTLAGLLLSGSHPLARSVNINGQALLYKARSAKYGQKGHTEGQNEGQRE